MRISHAGTGEVTTTHPHTLIQTYATDNNSPVHDEVLSPFSMEDQTSPDQLRKIKKKAEKGVKTNGEKNSMRLENPVQTES